MPDDDIGPAELRRWLLRIDATIANLVTGDRYEALERRVGDLEESRKSWQRLAGAAVLGVIVTAIVIALRIKTGTGATP